MISSKEVTVVSPLLIPLFLSLCCAGLFLLAGCEVVVATGTQSIDRVDDGVLLPPWGKGAPRLFLSLPQDYRVRPRKGPDFDVYEITKRGGEGAGGVVYIGVSPEHFHKRTDGANNVKRRMETIGTEQVEVYTFHIEDENFCQEAILARVYGATIPRTQRILVHLAAFGPNFDDIESLWQLLIRIQPD